MAQNCLGSYEYSTENTARINRSMAKLAAAKHKGVRWSSKLVEVLYFDPGAYTILPVHTSRTTKTLEQALRNCRPSQYVKNNDVTNGDILRTYAMQTQEEEWV